MVTSSMGVGLNKGSYLLTKLNSHLRRCIEGGLLETYWSNLIHNLSLKTDMISEPSDFVVFGLNHLGPLFILLIFGYCLSAIIFLGELIVNQLKIWKSRKYRSSNLGNAVKFRRCNRINALHRSILRYQLRHRIRVRNFEIY